MPRWSLPHLLTVLSLLPLIMIGGCIQETRQHLELVRFDFAGEATASALGPSHGGPAPLAAFTEGFSGPEGHGLWTIGQESTAHFYVVGKQVELVLGTSCSPPLSELGQGAELYWNDHLFASINVDQGWKIRVDSLQIDDSFVVNGWNRLRIVPRRVNRGEVHDSRALGIFLRSLMLTSQATAKELEARRAILDADEWVDEWEYAEVEIQHMRPASTRSFAGAMSQPAPDVMVIVLDAARADHFSGYGYHRETTPFVDQLTREGVSWSRAYSGSSFTLTSIASLFTGLPWRDHGLAHPEDALSKEPWTLAQLFRDNHYRTVAFSDNPYVGFGSRLGRGFAEFTEVRTHPRQVEHKKTIDTNAADWVQHRPAEMTQWLFEDWLEEGVQAQPYFMYFHIMPPHTPYVPGAEHDLWRDPQYQGPVTGAAEQVDEFVNHRFDYRPADLERLISLYDGNLHRGDEVARNIFEKWKALERGRELVVVLLSDHGEAFGEHGDFEHLTTVYDEMLHVPVVFWPQQSWAALEEKRDSLHSLSEVMPLLLGKAQIPLPPGSIWPEYFRRAYSTPGESERHNILVRSYALANQLGMRSADRLLVTNGSGLHELFDLASDPRQRQNLRFERADEYSRRLASLIRVLDGGPGGNAADAAAYTPEQLEALKAVGYVH
jgi:arylsulfatase A-like enzyme